MKQKLIKLLDVKSIVTIVLLAVFSVMSLTGRIEESSFMDMFQMVLIFYFGTQAGKTAPSAERKE